MSELEGFGPLVKVTPQSEQAETNQVQNNAGGYTFTVGPMDHFRRFLILGTSGGTYYASQRDHTAQGIAAVKTALDTYGVGAVEEIVEISRSGRAIKNDQAIFALAVACAHENLEVRRAACHAIPDVCRTGTHIFQFCGFVKEYRRFGRALAKGIARWYTQRNEDNLALQLVKYRQRNGWTHADVLRLVHPKTDSEERNKLFTFAVGKEAEQTNPKIVGYKRANDPEDALTPEQAVREFNIPWEALPTPIDAATWKALFETGNLPLGALIRQLPTLTRVGFFDDRAMVGEVIARLHNAEELQKARIHPYAALVAHLTYAKGKSARGANEWKPVTAISDALSDMFAMCFGNVQPMGGRTLLALDVSGSMEWSFVGNEGIVNCREASAAMSLVTAATEQPGFVDIVGFTSGARRGVYDPELTELDISPKQQLRDVVRTVSGLPFGGTDCGLPMRWAQHREIAYDRIVIYTDNETWAGPVHPHQALRDYRKAVSPEARLVVVAMTGTQFTIADPNDAGMLDVIGFDAAAPNLISAFARGEI